MTPVYLRSVPLNDLRNGQAGDWLFADRRSGEEGLHALSAKMDDWRSEFAICIHEAIEALLCMEHGITDLQVTQFDAQFEAERAAGNHGTFAEAGDDFRSPYFKEHQTATFVERAVCAALELDWEQHTQNVEELFQ
jgi:hypothetical protein